MAAGAAGLLAACGASSTSGGSSAAPAAPAPTTANVAPAATAAPTKAPLPKEITVVKTKGAESFDQAWRETWDAAGKAVGVQVNLQLEPGGTDFWDKRQQEYAGGVANADITYNQLNWFLVGGLRGMFVDLMPLLARDKVDPGQYIKADFESWLWKNKLWALTYQTGGEGVMLNRQIFQDKGVPVPGPNWTYDDLIQITQRLNDPAKNIAGVNIGQNGIQYMAGTFMRNYGGKVLNDQRNKAIYADDGNSIRGTETNVDLHQKYKVTPTADMMKLVPSGSSIFRSKMTAINIDYMGYVASLPDVGPGNIEILPPPKGPTGIQQARVAGNSWSILNLSKAQDGAWAVLKWMQTKDILKTPYLKTGIGWPAMTWAAQSPDWIDQFKGTNIAALQKVWETAGHNQVVLPEGDNALQLMNPPLADALAGKIGTKEALTQSQNAVNALFAQRPKEWEM